MTAVVSDMFFCEGVWGEGEAGVPTVLRSSSGVGRNPTVEVNRENFSSGNSFGMVVVPNTSRWLSETARACLATLLPCNEGCARDQPAAHASTSNSNTGKTNIL